MRDPDHQIRLYRLLRPNSADWNGQDSLAEFENVGTRMQNHATYELIANFISQPHEVFCISRGNYP